MKEQLIAQAREEISRGLAKWGHVDTSPEALLNAATEELGEVAHAINHGEPPEYIQQEIAEVIGVLSRIYDMVGGVETNEGK